MSVAPSDSAPLLTRKQVLRALRQITREGRPLPPSTVYELVYRDRRYPPRAVAGLAYRLATANPAAVWPTATAAAGGPPGARRPHRATVHPHGIPQPSHSR
ncbi:hypothetical protein [Hymenobacter siberiensis]|uniref:hypothetical protein n=1 Tax=Hymenobacter siberiensis TaxID=2848396 RepID=UPI001C1DE64B|nr:hypothetical protein [Hymenobacter siberiensis]